MIGFKNLKIPNSFKNIIKILILFLILILYFSSVWINKNYKGISLSETFFYIFSPITGSKTKIMASFIKNIFLKSLFFSLILTYILNKINNRIIKEKAIILKIRRFSFFNIINFFERRKDFLLNFNIFKFKLTIKIKRKFLFFILIILKIFTLFFLIKTSLNILKPLEYFNSFKKNSNFIEKNYINPKNVNIYFPKKKQNLVYIFVNTLEKKTNFKNNNNTIKFENISQLFGTNSKNEEIISKILGIPFKVDNKNKKFINSSLFKNIYGIGDILEQEGYKQLFLLSKNINTENYDKIIKNHGNFEIIDFNKAIQQKLIKKQQLNKQHELDNNQIFNIARNKLLNLSKQNKPFNILILTANSNFSNKIQKINQKTKNKNKKTKHYLTNTSNEIDNFLKWIKKQNLYKNTTIVICRDFLDENKHKISSIEFINSKVKTNNNKRLFSNLDIFPSVISSLGAKIKNDKLGLGTNLFSNEQTLVEKYKQDFINNEFKKESHFYNIYCI